MVAQVQTHITSLNWGYKGQLMTKEIKYFNALATVVDPHTIEIYNARKKTTEKVTAKYILVAVGGRPTYPVNLPNAKQDSITSDDLFSLKENPGKTLVVGASYVALECAGFLTGMGNDATVMVRSILLRGFDQDMAKRIGSYMETAGTKFINDAVPDKIEKLESGRKLVSWKTADGRVQSDEYDTILFAIGRSADTHLLGLDKIGVELDKANKKVIVKANDQSSVESIFAIGDVAKGRPELTPTAIMAGRMLAGRLFGGKTQLMDYKLVPTTVFTPLEYGCIGWSEEDALEHFGTDKLDIFHTSFKPLEWAFLSSRTSNACYIKMIVDKSENNKVVGLHYLGPNAGEVIQGYAVAMRMGATKEQFDNTVGIHPTTSEEILGLKTTKAEGEAEKDGC